MCFGCSKEPSHRDGSFEYSQHVLVGNKKNNFLLRTLIWGPETACLFTESSLNTKCLVPTTFQKANNSVTDQTVMRRAGMSLC